MPDDDSSSPPADGVARLLRWRDELRGVPPAVGRVRAHLEVVEPGTTTVRMPVHPELRLPGVGDGAGVPSLLADIGLTTAVVASLPHPLAVTTISMTVDHLAPTPTAGSLVAVSRASPYADGRPQHATGVVHDGDGRQVAAVSGWFLPAFVQAHATERVGVVREPAARHLLDLLDVSELAPHGGAFTFVAREALSNIAGTLHGGIGALACDAAVESAFAPEGRLLTSAFSYLRPTPRGGSVAVRADVVRRGRRTATAQCTVVGGDGRLALQATVVAALG